MATKIEWTDETWNPLVGCSRISEGCDHCYAIGTVHRGLAPQHRGLTVHVKGQGTDWNGTVRLAEHRLDEPPLRRTKPTRWFVNSLSDLFHPAVDDDTIARIFAVMAMAEQHTFQVLTKRPKRMAQLLGTDSWWEDVAAATCEFGDADNETIWRVGADGSSVGLPNVWLGTSIELDKYSWRADHLRATPAAVRFISAEPLLGPLRSLDLTSIDWLIVGGESGPGARPMHPQWVRQLRDWCTEAGYESGGPQGWVSTPVAFFFKQWGDWAPSDSSDAPWVSGGGGSAAHRVERVGKAAAGRDLDGRTWDEFPGGGS